MSETIPNSSAAFRDEQRTKVLCPLLKPKAYASAFVHLPEPAGAAVAATSATKPAGLDEFANPGPCPRQLVGRRPFGWKDEGSRVRHQLQIESGTRNISDTSSRKWIKESSRILQGQTAPLILAGVEEEVALYRHVNSYPRLVEQAVLGSPDAFEPNELHDRAMEIAREIQPPLLQKALDQVKEVSGNETRAFQCGRNRSAR